jgi:hypothetical protein
MHMTKIDKIHLRGCKIDEKKLGNSTAGNPPKARFQTSLMSTCRKILFKLSLLGRKKSMMHLKNIQCIHKQINNQAWQEKSSLIALSVFLMACDCRCIRLIIPAAHLQVEGFHVRTDRSSTTGRKSLYTWQHENKLGLFVWKRSI